VADVDGTRAARRAAQPALADILFGQGFGTRRHCAGLIDAGLVAVGGRVVTDPAAAFEVDGLEIMVDGKPWSCRQRALLMLHKPAGCECSTTPRAWPAVTTLLPPPLRQRGVQCVGRLDQDTTGLLLLTDDGPLLHRLTSPKHHVPKVYRATVKHALDEAQLRALRDGVVLHDSPKPVRAAAAHARAPRELELTLGEGKYHQVKRMVAAAGNRVVALHRHAIGALELPDDLAPGQWRWVDDESALFALFPRDDAG
jgi:16S rRNA pseudouridine516 synthase